MRFIPQFRLEENAQVVRLGENHLESEDPNPDEPAVMATNRRVPVPYCHWRVTGATPSPNNVTVASDRPT